MSRNSRYAAAALLAGAALALAAGSPAAQPRSCTVPGSRTVYANTEVRVFTRVDPSDFTTRTVACRKLDGARFKLAQDRRDYTQEKVEHFSRAGRRLGYAVLVNGRSATTGRACALNLDSGRRRCAGTLLVRGIGITPAGSIAWLADVGMDERCCTVRKLDAGATQQVELDFGFDIDRASFAVGGTHIYWTKAGQPKSATMP